MRVKEIESFCRQTAKKANLTFKRQRIKINGDHSYKFVERKTGLSVLLNCTLNSAYQNCLSGYFKNVK